MKEVVICSAVRTPIASFAGALSAVGAVELATVVIKEALHRAGLSGDKVDEVIMGHILQTGCKPNSARQASVYAGIPVEVPSITINKLCGSGLKAVNLAAQSIKADDNEIVVAGGMESMSTAPYSLHSVRSGIRMGHDKIHDTLLHDALICAFENYHMGMTAENVAEKHGITREEQDAFALSSQQKAVAAIKQGDFKEEIVPVVIKGKKGDIIFDTDEYPKADASLESLAKLKPAFKKEGTVTPGNASGVNDGAAAVVVASMEKAKELGLKPMAKILGYASSGIEPSIMGLAPVQAVKKALKKAGLKLEDMDFIEANEAFAAQFLGVGKELNFDLSKVNVRGGAIALGHPIGGSGARILVTLLHILKHNKAKYGLATLCIGGGQGVAMVVENFDR